MHIAQNESVFDRFGRIVIGGLLIVLATYVPMSAILVAAFIIVGAYLLITALAGSCPAYKIFGIKTCS